MNITEANHAAAKAIERDMVKDMTLTPAFNRVRKVSFLGAVDLFNSMYSEKNTWRFTRSDHTMGVVSLTCNLIELIRPNCEDRKYLLAAAVCHDLGHSPYSHSTEKVYRVINPLLNHKIALEHVISSPDLGLVDVLRRYNIDRDRLLSIIFGRDENLSWVFHCPLNVDTIDGMYRFLLSFRLHPPFMPARLVECVAALFLGIRKLSVDEIAECDNFWRVKSSFYEIFLDSGRYADFEKAYMDFVKERKYYVDIKDYLKDDDELFEEFDLSNMLNFWTSHRSVAVSRKTENFTIDLDVELGTIWDLYRRYKRHGG